jgi:hypothetical protein
MSDPRCRCNGTGWVIIDIPHEFQPSYGFTQGWAGCNVEEHRMNADDAPPEPKYDDPALNTDELDDLTGGNPYGHRS